MKYYFQKRRQYGIKVVNVLVTFGNDKSSQLSMLLNFFGGNLEFTGIKKLENFNSVQIIKLIKKFNIELFVAFQLPY